MQSLEFSKQGRRGLYVDSGTKNGTGTFPSKNQVKEVMCLLSAIKRYENKDGARDRHRYSADSLGTVDKKVLANDLLAWGKWRSDPE
jgi:hypothetical protein